jgi:LacI family transcriptional regulator
MGMVNLGLWGLAVDDFSHRCCLNPECPDHGKRGVGNVAPRGFYGPGKSRRLLYCKTCKVRFSERKGTPLFHCHLPQDKALAVLEHLDDGCGVRQTSRLVHVHQDTVMRLGRLAGSHAKDTHDELVSFSPLDDDVAAGREVELRAEEREELPPRRP